MSEPAGSWKASFPPPVSRFCTGRRSPSRQRYLPVSLAQWRPRQSSSDARCVGCRGVCCFLEHAGSGLVRLLSTTLDSKPDHHLFVRRLDLDDDRQVEALCRKADEIGAALVAIDALRRASAVDENSSNEVALIGRIAQRLTANGKRAVVLVHHDGKRGDPRGSTDLRALADSVVHLEPRGGKDGGLNLKAFHHDAAETSMYEAAGLGATRSEPSALSTPLTLQRAWWLSVFAGSRGRARGCALRALRSPIRGGEREKEPKARS